MAVNEKPVRCPRCRKVLLLAEPFETDQTNCPRCDFVFSPGADTETGSDGQWSLNLKTVQGFFPISPYTLLAPLGIGPQSSIDEIQDVFPESDQECSAVEALETVPGRLMVDLLAFPIWTRKE